MADSTPSLDLLVAFHRTQIGYAKGLAEMIDNGFNAGATRVELSFGAHEIRILDNGEGIRDWDGIAKLGAHIEGSLAGIGRYGVGLKDFALWLWGRMRVYTIHRGNGMRYAVRWKDERDWGKFPDPVRVEASATGIPEPAGTLFVFDEIAAGGGRAIPRSAAQVEKLVERLAEVYTPGLREGRQIVIRAHRLRAPFTVRALEAPLLDDPIDEWFDVAQRKRAHLRFGIVRQGIDNPQAGIALIYGFRVLKPRSAFACAPYGRQRVWGELTFDGAWGLERNKGGIEDSALDALELMVGRRIEGHLKRAEEQAERVELVDLERDLSRAVQQMLDEMGKAVRHRHGEVGTRAAKGSERKQKQADEIRGEGRTRRRKHPAELRVEFSEHLAENTMGETDLQSGCITLSLRQPWIRYCQREGNKPALIGAAMHLYAQASMDPQMRLPFRGTLPDSYAERVASFLRPPCESE